MPSFDVTVEKKLSPEMQAVADARQRVRQCESKVETDKGRLKQSKADWEEAVAKLNESIDTAVDSQRQPNLFGGASALLDPPDEPPEGGAASAVVDAEYAVEPSTAMVPVAGVAKCRVCGCTDNDCSGCYERTGTACHWVEPDLCSACLPPPKPKRQSKSKAK